MMEEKLKPDNLLYQKHTQTQALKWWSSAQYKPGQKFLMKSKPGLALFSAEQKNIPYSGTRNITCVLFIGVHKPGALI